MRACALFGLLLAAGLCGCAPAPTTAPPATKAERLPPEVTGDPPAKPVPRRP